MWTKYAKRSVPALLTRTSTEPMAATARRTDDFGEATRAFAEKRQPAFGGR